mgnify:FL=1
MTIPVPSAALVTKDGTPTLPLRQWMQEVQRVADGAAAKVAAAAAQTDTLSVVIARPKDGDTLFLRPFATGATITEVRTKSSAGTCTLTVKINATALGGTANSVSTTEVAQAHTSANVADTDDNLTLTVSANSGCTDLSVTITYTTTLASA